MASIFVSWPCLPVHFSKLLLSIPSFSLIRKSSPRMSARSTLVSLIASPHSITIHSGGRLFCMKGCKKQKDCVDARSFFFFASRTFLLCLYKTNNDHKQRMDITVEMLSAEESSLPHQPKDGRLPGSSEHADRIVSNMDTSQ